MVNVGNETGTGPPPIDVNQLLAREMTKLSLTERQKVYHDIHGVRDEIEESEELIQRSLQEMHREIKRISPGTAFESAATINPRYVKNQEFRLVFLRSEKFNSRRAARRIVQHFDFKMELFGKEKLGRDITLGDLDEQDRACLENGYFTVLPLRDRAGRAVASIETKRFHGPLRSELRSMWYQMMLTLQDVGVQRKGIVGLMYNPKAHDEMASKMDGERFLKVGKIATAMPMHIAGGHICTEETSDRMKAFLGIFLLAMDALARTHHKIHNGTPLEMIYELLTYGIPTQVLSWSPEMNGSLEYHREWIRQRTRVESSLDKQTSNESRAVVPGPKDVLTGREKIALKHVGNLRYHAMIDEYRDEFERATVKQKTDITRSILKNITDTEGRFLSMGDGGWVVLDENEARLKIATAFRSKRKAGKRAMIRAMKKGADSPQTIDSSSVDRSVSSRERDGSFDTSTSPVNGASSVGKRAKIW